MIFFVENRYALCQEHNKKCFPEAVNGYFLLKIGILCVRGIRKKFPSLRHEFLPIAPPTNQYYYIRMYLWKCMTMHLLLLYNLEYVLCPFAFKFTLVGLAKIANLQLTFLRFSENPFRRTHSIQAWSKTISIHGT